MVRRWTGLKTRHKINNGQKMRKLESDIQHANGGWGRIDYYLTINAK